VGLLRVLDVLTGRVLIDGLLTRSDSFFLYYLFRDFER